VGRSLLDLLAMFDAGGHTDVDEITHVVAREGQWIGELAQRALDGRDLLVEASVSMLSDDDGTVLGSVSILREISGRRAAERRIPTRRLTTASPACSIARHSWRS